MKITLRGVRGSIPCPGPQTVRYGGNTTCIDIVTADNERIVLDGGSGIRELGNELLAQLPVACSIFITHTHWDHIQGLPFFIPLFIPNNRIDIYGAFDPVEMADLREILSGQMRYCYFPVREDELKANISYTNLHEGQSINVGDAVVTNILMNHPVLNFGYRIDAGGKRFFFTGDHEPPLNIYEQDDPAYEEYAKLIGKRTKVITDFIGPADVMVADAQYTSEEYATKIGWGHGTYDSAIDMAAAAGVKTLYLTHHDPTRSDDALDAIHQSILARNDLPPGLEIKMAREGDIIEL